MMDTIILEQKLQSSNDTYIMNTVSSSLKTMDCISFLLRTVLIVIGRSFTIYTPSNQNERINKMVDVKMQTCLFSGNETCTSPVIGIITVVLKGPNFPKTFTVFAPYSIVRCVAPDEVHYVHERKEDI
jgi:hypothetical protein